MKNQPDEPLVRDLHRVLKYEVQFPGTFALSTVVPDCPNPGLDIGGVGRVPLPLTDQTAELITSVGDQAPFGRDMATVRDIIQIDGSNIRFMNPKWAPAIQKWVEDEVWSGLCCPPFISPPRCELHKLLLYKPGARFLPHQDTQKAPGMFASLVVVLPSEFTGGETYVSHGDENKVFDNAKDSAFETTTLAWYTGVTYEVKEITSGYRLALSYHLIDTSPGIEPPHLPSGDSGLQRLHDILSKWSNNGYPSLKVNQATAYAFTHLRLDYNASPRGVIKGKDQEIASILKQIGDSEGVLVLVGRLNVRVEGVTDKSGWQTYVGHKGSPEYGRATGGTYDIPVMSYVHWAKIWVDDIQDMQGRQIEIAGIRLDEHNVLPYRAFSGVEPDESAVCQGSWESRGADVEFAYRCAALVMFPKEKQLSLMLSSEEAEEWALDELERSKSEGPSKENREIVDFLARKERSDTTATILKIAIGWKDAAVWCGIVEQDPRFFLGQNGYTDLCNGWEMFKFEGVRGTFEKLFQERRNGLQVKSIKFLLFIKEKLALDTDPEKDEWISTQATRAMETFAPEKNREFYPGVVDIVRWKGLHFASSVVLPRFPEHALCDHRVGFGVGLVRHREELIALPRAEDQTVSNAELLTRVLDEILVAKIPPEFDHYRISWPHTVSSLLLICVSGNRMKFYSDLLGFISRPVEEPFYGQYLGLYAKIIPDLVKLLKERGISVSSSPSRKFFRYIIEMYLQEVLGSKEGSPYLKFSMLTCGHEACSQVNDFLRSEETKMKVPVDSAACRCATDLRIDQRYRLIERESYTGWERPSLDLIKSHEAMAAQHWSIRLADAQELLKSIGTDDEISRIMGGRYADVRRALGGSRAFVITETLRKKQMGHNGRPGSSDGVGQFVR